MINLLSYSVQQ